MGPASIRNHKEAIIGLFGKFILDQQLFQPQEKILIAVSGGLDSVVMTDLFHKSEFFFGIAHCNFKMRGKDSDEDEEFVKTLALRYKVPFFSNSFNTTEYAAGKGISIQMAARELRYAWFESIRVQEGYAWIATAHHLDDQIETFFINLLRGTGISGLHGILPKQGKVIRPMLCMFRRNIEEIAQKYRLLSREDTSNQSVKYMRNRIRHQLIPLLKEINPEVAPILTDTIQRIREFEEIGDQAIRETREKILKKEAGQYVIETGDLKNLKPLQTYAWELLSPFGFNQSVVGDILAALNDEPGKTFHSSTHRLIKDRKRIIILPNKEPKKDMPVHIQDFPARKMIKKPIRLSLRKVIYDKSLTIRGGREHASLDYNKLEFPLMLRKWEAGDAFFPFGMNKKKKLSHFFIDEKLSLTDKENVWLLCSGQSIVWVVGYRIDNRFRITSRTKMVVQITLQI